MTLLFETDDKRNVHIPNLHRYENVNGISVFSFDFYDKKGKGEDYRETVLCFNGIRIFFYKNNDEIEDKIYRALKGYYVEESGNRVSYKTDVLDLTDYEASVVRRKIGKHYDYTMRVV